MIENSMRFQTLKPLKNIENIENIEVAAE
jgi:hypothetical protein